MIPDGHFSHVEASHVLEHVPHDALFSRKDGTVEVLEHDGLVRVMNEVWRVLAPGGTFRIVVPQVECKHWWRAFADPSHRRYFVAQTFYHFGRPKDSPDFDPLLDKGEEGIETNFIIDSCHPHPELGDLTALLIKPQDAE